MPVRLSQNTNLPGLLNAKKIFWPKSSIWPSIDIFSPLIPNLTQIRNPSSDSSATAKMFLTNFTFINAQPDSCLSEFHEVMMMPFFPETISMHSPFVHIFHKIIESHNTLVMKFALMRCLKLKKLWIWGMKLRKALTAECKSINLQLFLINLQELFLVTP